MNKKEGITEAHVFHGLMRICVQREEKIVFVFLSIRNIVSFVPGKDLIPGRSSELEVDKGYLQNCMGVLAASCTPWGHPKAWEIQVGSTFSHWGVWAVRGKDEAPALETDETLTWWEESDPTTEEVSVRIAPPSNSLYPSYLCLVATP